MNVYIMRDEDKRTWHEGKLPSWADFNIVCDSCMMEHSRKKCHYVYIDEFPVSLFSEMLINQSSLKINAFQKTLGFMQVKCEITGRMFTPYYSLTLCHSCYSKHFGDRKL